MAWARSTAMAALLGVTGVSPLAAASLPLIAQSSSISFGPVTPTPRGYYDLCRRDGRLCRPTRSRGVLTTKTGIVVLTSDRLRDLAAVNASVNRELSPRSDASLYGVGDRWEADARAGDCEDFALAKRMRLIRAGWPSAAALVALARTHRGEEHAVLIARTDRGDLVLDNLTNEIRGWRRASLRLTSIQSPDSAWNWHKL